MAKAELYVGGCGRSGTTYLAKCFKTVGLDIPHEKLGSRGTVSWYFVPKAWKTQAPPMVKGTSKQHATGERPETTTFDHQLHLVRNPLKVIGSVPGVFTLNDWAFIIENAPWVGEVNAASAKTRKVIMAARYWCAWNELMSQRDPLFRFRVEDAKETWPRVMELLGESCAFPAEVSTKTNTVKSGWRMATPFTWADLKALDLGTYWRVRDLAKEYGYDTPA